MSTIHAGELINKTIEVQSPKNILIDNLRGDIEIFGWDKNKIVIKGELDDSAKSLVVKNKGHKVYIKVKMKGDSHSGDGSDLKVYIPASTSLWFKGVDTSFSFNDLNAGIEGRTINGDLVIKNVKTKIKASTVSGDVNIINSNGYAHIESVTGTIVLSGKYQEAYIKSMSGEIKSTIDQIQNLTTENVSGHTAIQGILQNKAQIKLSSVSGAIKYKSKGKLNAACELKSQFGGQIKNKITQDQPKRSMLKQELNFMSGDGSGNLIISTVTGSVSIED